MVTGSGAKRVDIAVPDNQWLYIWTLRLLCCSDNLYGHCHGEHSWVVWNISDILESTRSLPWGWQLQHWVSYIAFSYYTDIP